MNADRPDPSRPEDPDHGLDIDAAFADIVARLGPLGTPDEPPDEPPDQKPGQPSGRAPDEAPGQPEANGNDAPNGDATTTEPDPPEGQEPARGGEPPAPDPGADRLRSLFQPSWQDRLETPASWDDEGHFVPPEPPPLPQVDPRRRMAWAALLGSPVVALLLAVLPVAVPGWMSVLLVTAFVGGFGYLVATMRSAPPDDWSDDGARL